jgi:glycosyltransferase involved in cell wall biosynthesis
MPHRPLVSVIIPAYNAESYIDEALASVFNQTYPKLEVVVVNDGSTDCTAEHVDAYRPRVRHIEQSNSGGFPGAPRTAGIEHCSGQYICFLDADDVMAPDRVEKQADFLARYPEAGVVFTDYRNFSAKGPTEKSHFQTCFHLQEKLRNRPDLLLESAEATALLLLENFGIPSSMMIRREVLAKVPGFSTEMQIGEDFHFYYRVARHFGVGIINSVGALRRLHGSNITGDPLRLLHNCILSRTSLRDTESRVSNVKLLNEYLYRCEINLARAYADQRELKKALVHNVKALVEFSPRSIEHVNIGLRTLVRTGAIALHLKRPCAGIAPEPLSGAAGGDAR